MLSRCLQFHLRRLPLPLIYDRLASIAQAEQVEFEPGALRAVARGAEGSMRDALSLLDQVLAFGGGRVLEAEVRTLLGTLDRGHVQGLLAALAAKDGEALMQQAARLDERAPDYHQALGELAGAIQRLALLQALPDLPPGDDEDGDAMLRELAPLFAAEDLQLLYQIAINSRRDLDYAPDARAGFEMALLRMLAFRPAGPAPPGGGSSRDGGRDVGGATPVRTRPGAARPSAGSTRQSVHGDAAVEPARLAPVQEIIAEESWEAIVATLGLQGPTRQFAAHCVLLERRAGLVRLRLDPDGEAFRRPQIEGRIAQLLSDRFGEPTRLEIVLADDAGDLLTQAKRDALAAEDRRRAAEQAIESDPAVRRMRDVFGATVKPGSVRPLP